MYYQIPAIDEKMMKTLSEIKTILSKQKVDLSHRYNITAIGVFGSYVRGEQNASSDVDVLVEYKETPSLLKIANMENYLTDLLNEKVDLVPRDCIRPELKGSILSEVVMI